MTVAVEVIMGEDRRKKRIHTNAAVWTDPTVKNTCMLDPVGGSAPAGPIMGTSLISSGPSWGQRGP